MIEFWTQASPFFSLIGCGLAAWILRKLASLDTRTAVLETKLEHLKQQHGGD